jgi:hypothetical protein
MSNKKIFYLILVPCIIAVFIFIINIIIGPYLHGNPIGLFGNKESIWFTIIPVAMALNGLVLSLVITPIIFYGSVKRLINREPNWALPFVLAPFTCVLGAAMNYTLGYFAYYLVFPVIVLVFIVSLFITIISLSVNRGM